MKRSIGVWDVFLDDDGTLDTVLLVQMRVQPRVQYYERFSDVERNEDGGLSEEMFRDLAEIAVEAVEEQRL